MITAACLAALSMAVVSGCGGSSSSPGGSPSGNPATLQGAFVAASNGYAELLQLTTTGGSIHGSIQGAGLSASGLSVGATSGAVTGTANGTSVTLQTASQTLAGSLSAFGLTLNIPQADGSLMPLLFVPSTIAAYNQAVATLQGQAAAASSNAAAASANAAAASAAASQSAASASAAASAAAANSLARKEATACAAIGGHVGAPGSTFPGNCVSNINGDPSGQPGADCQYTEVGFNGDGSIDQGQYSTAKDFYPGCFK